MSDAADREAIVHHIHGIFDAFLKKDRAAIRRGHTDDWRGFQVGSRAIVRGIDEYMTAADDVLRVLRATRYDMLDVEVQVDGDRAVVFYVARDFLTDEDGLERTVLLRAVDLYRREPAGWNQCGSHVAALSEGPVDADADRCNLLEAREAVWRAWFTNDQEHLRRVLPDDLRALHAGDTKWLGRDEVLREAAAFATSGAAVTRLDFEQTDVQRYGDVAILYTTARWEVASGDRTDVYRARGVEVFVRRDGRWVNTGWHLQALEA